MSPQRKRRHHTVPKSHLRRFADDRNQLMRVVLPGTTRHRISINDATVEKDFYTIVGPDGEPSDELEDAFAELEGAAETAVRELVDERRWPVPRQAREDLAAWCALQNLRTSVKRQAVNQIADFVAKVSIARGGKEAIRASIEESENRPATEEEVERAWAEATAFDTYVVDQGNLLHLSSIMTLWPVAIPHFVNRGWHPIYFERKALITSDSPVVLVWEPGLDSLDRLLGGFGVAVSAILVPLDRRVGLYLSRPGDPDGPEPASTAWAKQFNLRLANDAWRAVFHHPDDDPLADVDLPEPRTRAMEGGDPSVLLSRPSMDSR
jgi:hypothetical protein